MAQNDSGVSITTHQHASFSEDRAQDARENIVAWDLSKTYPQCPTVKNTCLAAQYGTAGESSE